MITSRLSFWLAVASAVLQGQKEIIERTRKTACSAASHHPEYHGCQIFKILGKAYVFLNTYHSPKENIEFPGDQNRLKL